MTDDHAGSGNGAPLDPETFARFAVRDAREIVQLMHALIEKRPLLTAQATPGPSFLTVLLAVTPPSGSAGGSVLIDAPSDEAVTTRVVAATELVCTTRLDNVQVQFSLGALGRAVHEGRAALQAPLPDSVLRLQRREFFRLQTPHTGAPVCAITTDGASGKKKTVSVRILDISGGGLAILVPPKELDFAPSREFADCLLMLTDGPPLPVRLIVRNLFEVERPNGIKVLRAGCEFVGQTTAGSARIQRYIFKVERDRKARESGY